MLAAHEGHSLQGVVSQRTHVLLNIEDGKLAPDWGAGEEMLANEILNARCNDCDVWLISEEVDDGSQS